MPDGSVRLQNGFHVTWRSSLRRDAVWPCENIPRPAIWPGRSQIVTGYTSYAELPRLHPEAGITNKSWQSSEGAGMSATLGPMSMSQTQGDTKRDGTRRRYSRRKREPSGEKELRLKPLGQSQSEPALQHAFGDESPNSGATLPALAASPQGSDKTIQGRGRRGINTRRESAETFEKVHLPMLMSRGYAAEAQKARKRRPSRTFSSERLEQSPSVLRNRSEASPDRKTSLEASPSSLRNRSEASPDRKTSLEASPVKRKVLYTQLHHTALQESPFPRSPSGIQIPQNNVNPRVASPFDHRKGSIALQEISSIATQISEDLALQEQRWLTTTLTQSSIDVNGTMVVPNRESKSPNSIPLSAGNSLLLPVLHKTASPPGSGPSSSRSQLKQVPEVLPSCGKFSATPAEPRSRSPSPAVNKSGKLNLPSRGTSGGSDRQTGSAKSSASPQLLASPRLQASGGKPRATSGGSVRRTPASARRTPVSTSSTGGTNEESPDTAVPGVNAPADSTGDAPIAGQVHNESERKDSEDDFTGGFNEDGIVRLRGAFFRFTEAYSADLCIRDNLAELLKYLGHQVTNATEKGVMELVKGITPYDYLNFDEFLSFMEKYISFEEEQFRMEFEKADDDDSGELSVFELREVMKSLGIRPLQAMVREAVSHVDKDSNCQLNFEEFMQFLNVYRRYEGFTSEEVSDLLQAYNQFAGDGPFWSNLLVPALTQFFGRHITDKAKIIEKELSERMKLEGRVDTSLTFEDFLILARRVRERYYEGILERSKCAPIRAPEDENQKRFREWVLADKNKNDKICRKELKKALRDQGYEPLAQVLNEIYAEILEEGWQPDVELDFDQFFDFLLVYRRREGFSKAQVEDMLSVYRQYDEDASESISSLELDNIFRHLGYTLNMDDIHHYLHIVDDDQSNELDFREFLHLMQLHRCTEIQEMRRTFKKYCLDDAVQSNNSLKVKIRADKSVKVYELPKSVVTAALADCKYKELPEGLEIPQTTDFDCFVSLADKCRSIFVASQRRKAGYADNEIKALRESFDIFDSDNSGTIDHSELAKVLESFGWKPKTRQDRDDLLGRLEKARVLAKEAGVKHVTPAGSAEVSFWEFIQLKRMIQRHEDTAHEEHMKKLMKELSFTATEAEEFREIFRAWVEVGDGDDVEEDGVESSGGGWHEKGNLSKRAVRQQVRSLCGKIPGDRRRGLEKQLNDLDDDNIGLDFEKFLRLMRWLLDSHFMDDVFKKSDKKSDDAFKS